MPERHPPDARKRRLLFLTYEFPPSAGGGVQRVAKLASYLPASGWIPVVLTAEPVPGKPQDATLLDAVADTEVVRLPARSLPAALARLTGPAKKLLGRPRGAGERDASGASASVRPRKPPLTMRVARWLLVPDPGLPWARLAARTARRLHAVSPFDAIFASGPPYSTIVEAARLGRQMGIPAVVDLRDAWRDNVAGIFPSDRHRQSAERLERLVMADAAAVVVVSEGIGVEARELGARNIHVVPNGFDPADMPGWRPDPDAPVTIVFMGRLNATVTDPDDLFAAWALAKAEAPALGDARLLVVGPEAPWVLDEARRHGLEDNVSLLGFRPHREALEQVARADLALLLLSDSAGAEAIYSGKLFEYLGVGVPVMLIGPPSGAAARLIEEARAGVAIGNGDVEGAARVLVEVASAKEQGRDWASPDPEVAARFDRRRQAGRIAEILDRVTGSQT